MTTRTGMEMSEQPVFTAIVFDHKKRGVLLRVRHEEKEEVNCATIVVPDFFLVRLSASLPSM